jgi:hypothetical protein
MESDLELMCSWVACARKLSPVALVVSKRGILHLAQISPFGQRVEGGTLLACY